MTPLPSPPSPRSRSTDSTHEQWRLPFGSLHFNPSHPSFHPSRQGQDITAHQRTKGSHLPSSSLPAALSSRIWAFCSSNPASATCRSHGKVQINLIRAWPAADGMRDASFFHRASVRAGRPSARSMYALVNPLLFRLLRRCTIDAFLRSDNARSIVWSLGGRYSSNPHVRHVGASIATCRTPRNGSCSSRESLLMKSSPLPQYTHPRPSMVLSFLREVFSVSKRQPKGCLASFVCSMERFDDPLLLSIAEKIG